MYHERGVWAPKRSFISLAHIPRAALNLATSSKKWLWADEKKESREAKSSIFMPFWRQVWTTSMATQKVKASSWTAVQPASLILYPSKLMIFQRGLSLVQNRTGSTVMRRLGGGGKACKLEAMWPARELLVAIPV